MFCHWKPQQINEHSENTTLYFWLVYCDILHEIFWNWIHFLISHTSLKSKFLDNRCLLDLYDDVLSIGYLNVTITKRQLKNHRKHQNHIEILLSVSNYEFVESSKHLFLLLQNKNNLFTTAVCYCWQQFHIFKHINSQEMFTLQKFYDNSWAGRGRCYLVYRALQKVPK